MTDLHLPSLKDVMEAVANYFSGCDGYLDNLAGAAPRRGGSQLHERLFRVLLGHTKIENTVRYFSVDVGDSLTLTEGIEV